jgi:putative nucleotidyltransferase-like protein
VRGLPELIAFEGCATWSYRRLRQIGALERIDDEVREWLSARAREETARNLLIESEAEVLTRVFHRLQTPAVFMKGVARRLSVDRYPMADARTTNDVDVLLPVGRAREVWFELRQMGYERTTPHGPPRPDHHHLPAVWGERRVGVEIHTTHARPISPAESWRRHFEQGREVDRGGLRYRVPGATELFWSGTAHGLRHPDIAFLLVLLLDAAVILASGEAVEWEEIARRLDAKEIQDARAAAAWLGAAVSLAGVPVPAALRGRVVPYDLGRELELRLAVLRRVPVPSGWRKMLAWWSSEQARATS